MKTALWILGSLLAGLVGQEAIAAESDTLTVVVNATGLKEFKKTVNMGETLTIDVPPANPDAGTSDVLKIPAFTIKLMPDPGVGATTTTEGAGWEIKAVALSDVSGFRSDSLSFEDTMDRKSSVFLKEAEETNPFGFTFVPLRYPGAEIPLGPDENGKGKNSDMLIIPPFTMMLGSDFRDAKPDDPDVLNWSIDITAGSDSNVPEPATWVMMLLGFAGLGFVGYRASRRGVLPIA
jgi:PEP-CTERM motif